MLAKPAGAKQSRALAGRSALQARWHRRDEVHSPTVCRRCAQVTQDLGDTGTDLTASALSKRSRARLHLGRKEARTIRFVSGSARSTKGDGSMAGRVNPHPGILLYTRI